MLKQIGALLAGLLFATTANAFSIYSGDIKVEFTVGNYVGAPILRVTDTFYESSIANYNCNWKVAIAAEKSVGDVNCLSYASTEDFNIHESLKVNAKINIDTLASAAIEFSYTGGSILAEEAALLSPLSGTHEIGDVGPTSIVHSMKAMKDAVMGYVGQEMISKILSAEMGVDVTRPIERIRLDVANGRIIATVDLKYNTPEFNSNIQLGGVLDISGKTSIDAEALKAGIATALANYNEANRKK